MNNNEFKKKDPYLLVLNDSKSAWAIRKPKMYSVHKQIQCFLNSYVSSYIKIF